MANQSGSFAAAKKFLRSRKTAVFMQWFVLAALVVILAVTLYYTVRNFELVRLRGDIRRQNRGAVLAPEQIQPWMTFRYLNLVYRLPSGYLRSSLQITDSQYPNLSVAKLAKEKKTNTAQVLSQTSQDIKNFSAPGSP